jgi:hypothetical protein
MLEPTDLDLRGVRIGALAILGGIAFAIAAAWLLLHFLEPAANAPRRAIDAPSGPAAPRLQSAPQPDRAAYYADKERLLSSYGWVDREAGVARIPLQEAMRLVAEQGGRNPAVQPGAAPADAAAGTIQAATRHAARRAVPAKPREGAR